MTVQKFKPIAIVGRSCVLPGIKSPEELWDVVHGQRSVINHPVDGRWRLSRERVLGSADTLSEGAWTELGGHVGKGPFWQPTNGQHNVSLETLDPLFHWVFHSAEEALSQAMAVDSSRTGAIFGNLSFPSEGMSAYAEAQWLKSGELAERHSEQAPATAENPLNRFMSGYPVMLLQKTSKKQI